MISEAPRGAGESAKQHCASPWGPGAGRVLPKPWPDILSEPLLGSQSKARVLSPALSTGVEDPWGLGSLLFTDLCSRDKAGQTETALAELLATVDMEPVGMQWSERHLSDPKKAANTKYKSSKASRCSADVLARARTWAQVYAGKASPGLFTQCVLPHHSRPPPETKLRISFILSMWSKPLSYMSDSNLIT